MLMCDLKGNFVFLFSLFIGTSTVIGQNIVVDPNFTPQELVQDIFITHTCFQVENITYTGEANAIGAFSNGLMGVGMEEGVILSSGNVADAVGPNASGFTATFQPGLTTDVDLEDIAVFPGGSDDVAILEFDFIPSINTVNFDFVFASEEYPEFVNSYVNDAFGFFISGPGFTGPFLNGAENVALIPGTTIPITIDNVNAGSNNAFYNDNTGGANLEYDGYTTVITAEFTVVPCETYHIKMAISDMGDDDYDSAVFLGANSFNAGEGTLVTSQVNDVGATNVYEDCVDGSFVFTRADISDLSMDITVTYTITGTAINGTDYVTIPSMITIPAGQESFELLIEAIEDNIPEGTEEIVLTITSEWCACSSPESTLSIFDSVPLSVSGSTTESVCPGDPITIGVTVDTGTPPYDYSWFGPGTVGVTTGTVTVTPTSDSNYTVLVTDACDETESLQIAVSANNCLPACSTIQFIQN